MALWEELGFRFASVCPAIGASDLYVLQAISKAHRETIIIAWLVFFAVAAFCIWLDMHHKD